MPNFVAHASGGKAPGLAETRSSPEHVERVETVDCVKNYAEEVAAQYAKPSTQLESQLLGRYAVTAILRPAEEMSHHLYGYLE
jgi:hypothetical protein